MKNKKMITLIATLGLMTCLYSKVDAVKFYDTLGTRYEGAVERLSELEIVDGVSNKVFNAEKKVTRAEFAKMITKILLNENEFNALIIDDSNCQYKDVSKSDWFYEYVVAASNYGLINGYNDNTFRPDKEVTYEEAAKMLLKGLGHTYLREDNPEGWAKEYLEKMYEYKLTEGALNFEEKEGATRGNIAIMMWNALTKNTWEKIFLNETNGFTFVDSGKTLFSHNFSEDYAYLKEVEIKDVKEIDGKLNVRIGNRYYRLYDQDSTFKFSMLGGKATALLYKIRDAEDKVEEEVIIGLSTDIGMDLYEGTLKELSEDDFSYSGKIFKASSNADYGYLIYNEAEEEVERVVTFNSKGSRMYIEKIEIKEDKQQNSDDDDEENKDETITKTINLNDEKYIISDGAVLFYNNKRVEWKTVQEGDVITEVKEDEYYILMRKSVDVKIDSFEKESNYYIFATPIGEFTTYSDTQCVEYLSTKISRLNSISKDTLTEMIGKEAKLTLDFAGKVVRIEFLDSYTETELTDVGVGYFESISYANDTQNGYSMLTVILDGKKKVYRTTLTSVGVSYGDLMAIEIDTKGIVTNIKKIDSAVDLNEKVKVKVLTYRNLMDRMDDGEITEETPIYQTIYEYDFGVYEEFEEFTTQKIDMNKISDMNSEKIKIYAITNDEDEIQVLLIEDYSNKKDTFYGKVNLIYRDEDKDIRIEISVLGDTKRDFKVSGLLNCEEGDLVSFKRLNDDTVKILEKYTPSALGYYKDIVVERVKNNSIIETELGTFDLEAEKMIVEDKEYVLADYVYILVRVNKDQDDNWKFVQVKYLEKDELDLENGDRIAIDEIENTIIIYRGYTES